MDEKTIAHNRSKSWELRCRFFVVVMWILGIGIMQHIITIIMAGVALFIPMCFCAKSYRKYLLRNTLIVMPFLLVSFVTLLFSDGFPISKDAAGFAGLIATRMIVCVLTVSLVTGNEIRDYLAIFHAMRFPDTLTSTLFLTQHYVHVIGRQLAATRNALISRLFSSKIRLRTLKIYGQIIGGMTIHAVDRSEHIRKAMESRGFHGKMPIGPATPIRMQDVLKTVSSVLVPVIIVFAERWCFS